MSVAAGGKLNKGGYFLRPYSLFRNIEGRKPSCTETIVKGVIFSYSRADQNCRYGYKRFRERLQVSKSTVARSVALLKKDTSFHVERNGGKCSEYTYKGDKSKSFITTPDFFVTSKFLVQGSERRLTGAEINVLSLIYSHTWDGQKFEASYKEIAGILNCATKTVVRAVFALFSADLIARPVKGVNGHQKNSFCVQMRMLRRYEKMSRKTEKKAAKDVGTSSVAAPIVSQETKNANARAEYKRYYDLLRNQAEMKAQRNVDRARKVSTVFQDLRTLELQIVKAECFEPEKLPALEKSKKRLNELGTQVLQGLKLTWEDLEPQYKCKKCADTGWRLSSGEQCDCYPKGKV